MPPLAPSSRRALVGAAALAALAPAAGAKRKKKKKRKKPKAPPPLAFAVGALVDVTPSGNGNRFDAVIEVAFLHPASGLDGEVTLSVTIEAPESDAALRAAIAAKVRQDVFTTLRLQGQDVLADRIAVAVM